MVVKECCLSTPKCMHFKESPSWCTLKGTVPTTVYVYIVCSVHAKTAPLGHHAYHRHMILVMCYIHTCLHISVITYMYKYTYVCVCVYVC